MQVAPAELVNHISPLRSLYMWKKSTDVQVVVRLESLIVHCPLVLDVAVIGVWSDEKQTEFPRAYVVLNPGVEKNENTRRDIAEYGPPVVFFYYLVAFTNFRTFPSQYHLAWWDINV